MASAADRKQNQMKKQLMNRSPIQRYEWLLALKEGTRCILKVEDKYRVYRRMESEFSELSEYVNGEDDDFDKQSECATLRDECKKIADEMESELPEEMEQVSRTVMMSAGERHDSDKQAEGSHGVFRWILLGILVLAVAFAVCYKIPTTRAVIGDIESAIGLNSLAVKSYRVSGDTSNGWQKAVELERDIIGRAEIGAKVKFGKLEWIVLDKDEKNGTLIAAKDAIKDKRFDKTGKGEWFDSSLRGYLNSKFIKQNFYPMEIQSVTDINANGLKDGAKDATDKVFIPSIADIEKYGDILGDKIHNLRLLDRGESEDTTAFVSAEGNIIKKGFPADEKGCFVRPMIWVMK